MCFEINFLAPNSICCKTKSVSSVTSVSVSVIIKSWILKKYVNSWFGQIQGDGRKFLDHLKSYFWSHISSKSLNEIHSCWLQPKSATKGELFHIFLSLSVSSSRLILPFDVWPSFPVTTWMLPYADFGKIIVFTTERSQTAFFPRSFSMVFNCCSLFNEAAHLAALRRFRSPFAIRDANSKQSKTIFYYFVNHLLLRILAVIGRYGPNLMIVIIFVTKNNC